MSYYLGMHAQHRFLAYIFSHSAVFSFVRAAIQLLVSEKITTASTVEIGVCCNCILNRVLLFECRLFRASDDTHEMSNNNETK